MNKFEDLEKALKSFSQLPNNPLLILLNEIKYLQEQIDVLRQDKISWDDS